MDMDDSKYLKDALISLQYFPRLIGFTVQVICYGERYPILPKVRT